MGEDGSAGESAVVLNTLSPHRQLLKDRDVHVYSGHLYCTSLLPTLYFTFLVGALCLNLYMYE